MKNYLGILILMVLYSSVNLNAQVPNYVPTNNLVAWYPFNGNANDESQSGLNGVIYEATPTADRFGNENSAYFFADFQNIIVPNTEDKNLFPITVSLWYNADSIGDEHWRFGVLFRKYGTASWNGFNIIFSDNRNIGNMDSIWNFGYGAVPWYLRSTQDRLIGFYNEDAFVQEFAELHTWHHIVFTVDGEIGKLYANGRLVSTHEWTGESGPSANSNLWEIGGGEGDHWYQGEIDDVGIWDRALSEDEVIDLYRGEICHEFVTVTDTLIINANITSFNPIEYQTSIKVYPNPAKDHLIIDNGDVSKLNGYQLRILNSAGAEVYHTTIDQQLLTIDLNSWTGRGLYFVHFVDDRGNTVDIKKIILQ